MGRAQKRLEHLSQGYEGDQWPYYSRVCRGELGGYPTDTLSKVWVNRVLFLQGGRSQDD